MGSRKKKKRFLKSFMMTIDTQTVVHFAFSHAESSRVQRSGERTCVLLDVQVRATSGSIHAFAESVPDSDFCPPFSPLHDMHYLSASLSPAVRYRPDPKTTTKPSKPHQCYDTARGWPTQVAPPPLHSLRATTRCTAKPEIHTRYPPTTTSDTCRGYVGIRSYRLDHIRPQLAVTRRSRGSWVASRRSSSRLPPVLPFSALRPAATPRLTSPSPPAPTHGCHTTTLL